MGRWKLDLPLPVHHARALNWAPTLKSTMNRYLSASLSAHRAHMPPSPSLWEPIPTLFTSKVAGTVLSFVQSCREACFFVQRCEKCDIHRPPYWSHRQCTLFLTVQSSNNISYRLQSGPLLSPLVKELWDWICLDMFPHFVFILNFMYYNDCFWVSFWFPTPSFCSFILC